MVIDLPKDATGREIPLDVDALYDKNGERVEVFRWSYVRGRNNNWAFYRVFEFATIPHYPQDYYLEPPDSLEKLSEDLDRCYASTRYIPCEYFDMANDGCDKCPADANKECLVQMVEHVAQRIHKLKGEDR